MFFLPSRHRPDNINRFFRHWHQTGATAKGVLWLDDDDAFHYHGISIPTSWQLIIRPPMNGGTGAITNAFFTLFPNEPWYGLLGDDIIPRTEGWDQKLIEAANDGLAYCDDGIHGEAHAAHPVIRGDLVRELGWLALPGCQRLYIDNALFEYAKKRAKAVYLPDVLMEHMHFSNGKAPIDDTYLKPPSRDREIFDEWMKTL